LNSDVFFRKPLTWVSVVLDTAQEFCMQLRMYRSIRNWFSYHPL